MTGDAMDLFGYDVDDLQGEPRDRPRTLAEATLAAGPAELRELAAFLVRCAELMEQHDGDFGHEHFSDHVRPRTIDADLIVVRARS